MEPINANSLVSPISFRSVGPVQSSPQAAELSSDFFEVQRQTDVRAAALINQLPESPAQNVVRVFTRINSLGLQAAEIGQTTEGRQSLQTEAGSELQTLRTALDELTRDDLQLFAAVFQNQLPDFFSNANTSSSDSLLSDSSVISSSENILESLFQIDLRTDQGVLSALDLSGSILDTFSVFNTGSDVFESFFDDFLNFSFNLTVIDTILAAQTTDSTTGDNIDQTLSEPDAPLVSPQSGQPTIIELAG